MTDFKLYGRVLITANILAVTGLHIGGSNTGLEIGGLDKAVIRNPLDGQPYIPGSSLRGKMRSQTEKVLGLEQNNRIAKVTIHTCKTRGEYEKGDGCVVCHVFGVPAELEFSGPTRLLVRDTALNEKSAGDLEKAHTELRYAELKTEVAIDRVTSAATPRTMERVPAGAVFGPLEMVFGVYQANDFERLRAVIQALQLVQDDYLGGSGSRGSGKVEFKDIKISARSNQEYGVQHLYREDKPLFESVQALNDDFGELSKWLKNLIKVG